MSESIDIVLKFLSSMLKREPGFFHRQKDGRQLTFDVGLT